MAKAKASPLDGYTAEEIALIKSELAQANKEVEILRELSGHAHQQAAMWAAAACELMRILGKARLDAIGFAMPDASYMTKFHELVNELSKETT